MIYQVGDFYNDNGVTGIVIFVDDTMMHGKVISLDEKHCNWHDANKWCSTLGPGWCLPSKNDYERISDVGTLDRIQYGLIHYGMPFCFGDDSCNGTNRQGHIYWTKDGSGDWMYVFCPNLYCPSFSTDNKDAEYEEVRAVKAF